MSFYFVDVIQKNLESLRENIEKKKRAQDAYYEVHSSHLYQSPLTRDRNRRPVKQRLGRNVPYSGTNTSFLPPKQRLRKVHTLNNSINQRKIRNTAQQRLYNIMNRNQENHFNEAPRRMRLRKLVNERNIDGNSLQVKVFNNMAKSNDRFRQKLDVTIQMEIKKIQLQSTRDKDSSVPTKITPAYTVKNLHDRFALLK